MSIYFDISILVAISISCLLPSFFKPRNYVTTGYSMSIVLQSLCILILYRECLSKSFVTLLKQGFFIHCILFMLYGIRLTLYILIGSFNRLVNQSELGKVQYELSTLKSLIMLLSCCSLYFCMISPLLINARSLYSGYTTYLTIKHIGLLFMVVGIITESAADYQKTCYSNNHPEFYIKKGLYTYIRMPNYLGEILFWIGNSITSLCTQKEYILVLCNIIGSIFSISIMIYAACDLDRKQRNRYENDIDYYIYRSNTSLLIPKLSYTILNPKKVKHKRN